ncbi:MAG: hypothetical protein US50_C0001G0011 [Candidatus Nomurabacteria bacterium GW2011_GWB1_37_5]|uniref:Restriction endonuclease type II-like domain-containing protein n=1 Tax=Candidatus Nomurabacteria bacterium GW2011_GWB1_37_5 TaxID=1618742 RepID=A0A0G0JGX9_9BACT|nr:MAG: hypothetical protein US50_C0001G0011 [Candidatus Nomurabacteria bacterium GW2011_GWB1_37_5]
MTKANLTHKTNHVVLVGVLKNKNDLKTLLEHHWYRIPISHSPIKHFDYLAFYQPISFGKNGKRINYYAKVLRTEITKRSKALPKERLHPRAGNFYLICYVGKIIRLKKPIKNTAPRRVTFGFTTLNKLRNSKNLLELFNIAPIEIMIENKLKQAGIKALKEHTITANKKRYRLDFAIYGKNKKLAIECDNQASHSTPQQKIKDKIKNTNLKSDGWTILRLSENMIINDIEECLTKIKKLSSDLRE